MPQLPTNWDDPNPLKQYTLTYEDKVLPGTMGTASGTSSVYDLQGWTLTAIEIPGTMASGTLTFQGANNQQGAYRPIYELTVIGTAGNQIITDIPELAPLRFIKVIAGGTQSTAQVINLLVK